MQQMPMPMQIKEEETRDRYREREIVDGTSRSPIIKSLENNNISTKMKMTEFIRKSTLMWKPEEKRAVLLGCFLLLAALLFTFYPDYTPPPPVLVKKMGVDGGRGPLNWVWGMQVQEGGGGGEKEEEEEEQRETEIQKEIPPPLAVTETETEAETERERREREEEECDLFEGKWVWDEVGYPLYESKDCPFLDGGFRCSENGRPDRLYTHWRWQPHGCNLPRFDAKIMLEKLRNKRLVFAGDSIGRNQWESLLCMLSSAVADKSSIYEVNGNPITKHMGFLAFKFRDYNSTVEYYRAPFLVQHSRPPRGAPKEVVTTLKLDLLGFMAKQWKDADVLIFNTGHWWSYEKTVKRGHYFQEGNMVKMEMSVENAYQRSIKTLLEWIHAEVNMSKTQVYFRTYAPVHFRFGDWKTGGSCHLETLPESNSSQVQLSSWSNLLNPFQNVSRKHSSQVPIQELQVLNITHMTAERKDGHLSLYYLGPNNQAPPHRQDCSHWCLPGVPDAWNEILYALFLKRENAVNQKTTAGAPLGLN